jgi:hypothetical protein
MTHLSRWIHAATTESNVSSEISRKSAGLSFVVFPDLGCDIQRCQAWAIGRVRHSSDFSYANAFSRSRGIMGRRIAQMEGYCEEIPSTKLGTRPWMAVTDQRIETKALSWSIC